MKCNRALTFNEIALHRKVINRGAKEFMCLTCLAEYLNSDEKTLKEKIDFFRRQGCSLF